MYYHCCDDGYIVTTLTKCEQPLPFVVRFSGRDYIITATNLSSTELVNWIITHDHEPMADARRIAISAIDEVFRDQENN